MLNTGDLACWGDNAYGQIGSSMINRTSSIPFVVTLPPGTTAVSVAAGSAHTCVILSTGDLYCFGSNLYGTLGNGDDTVPYSTVPIRAQLPSGTTAVSVAAGYAHTCAILNSGGVVCFGGNSFGSLGGGVPTNYDTLRSAVQPVLLPPGSTAVSVAAGSHTCTSLSSGDIYCWGPNFQGQLGNNSFSNTFVPVRVALGLLRSNLTAVSVSVGSMFTCAVLTTGEVACWGYNEYGNLGDGTEISRSDPRLVSLPRGSVAVSVACGTTHSCASLKTGEVMCWGFNVYGVLGIGFHGSTREAAIRNLPRLVPEYPPAVPIKPYTRTYPAAATIIVAPHAAASLLGFAVYLFKLRFKISELHWRAWAIVFLSILDTNTDIFYILTSSYYNLELKIAGLVFLLAPLVMYIGLHMFVFDPMHSSVYRFRAETKPWLASRAAFFLAPIGCEYPWILYLKVYRYHLSRLGQDTKGSLLLSLVKVVYFMLLCVPHLLLLLAAVLLHGIWLILFPCVLAFCYSTRLNALPFVSKLLAIPEASEENVVDGMNVVLKWRSVGIETVFETVPQIVLQVSIYRLRRNFPFYDRPGWCHDHLHKLMKMLCLVASAFNNDNKPLALYLS